MSSRFSNLAPIFRYLFDPDRHLIAIGNVVFAAFSLCASILLGSIVSVYVIGGMLYSAFHIWRRVVPWQLDKPAIWTTLAFASFFAAELIAHLVNPSQGGVAEVVSNLPFLGFLAIYSLFVVDRTIVLNAVERTAAIVAILAAIAAILSPTTVTARVELSAGNPGIAAVLASVLYLINIIALCRRGQSYWWLSIVGAAASITVILLIGMRSLWPCLVIFPLIVIWQFRSNLKLMLNTRSVVITTLVLLVVTGVSTNTIMQRFQAVGSDLQEMEKGDYSSSLGMRVILWKAGKDLVVQQPLFGYGPGSVDDNIGKIVTPMGKEGSNFTHFHNAALNELVRAGVIGLVALISMFVVPLYFVVQSSKGELRTWSLALLIGVQVAFLLSGLTGIMFGHDIMDTLYLVVSAVCLFLVRQGSDDEFVTVDHAVMSKSI